MYGQQETKYMQPTIKHAGVEYSTDLLVAVKGQGTIVKTNEAECIASTSTLMCSTIDKPIVVKSGSTLVILLDSIQPRHKSNFAVTLLSKHILKKAKKTEEVPVAKPFNPVIIGSRVGAAEQTRRALAALSGLGNHSRN
jgi:hypothetical protein